MTGMQGLVLSDDFMAHEARGLPEKPARISAIRGALGQTGLLAELVPVAVPFADDIPSKEAALAWMKTNHEPAFIDWFIEADRKIKAGDQDAPRYLSTGETPLSASTFDVTWRATAAVLKAVDQVARGELTNAFCAVRPPGHHAEPDHGEGFCYVNHIAIAANYLRLTREGFYQPDGSNVKIDRVLIVDFDLHHGNGAQKSFYAEPDVMFCSLHGDPRQLPYPGTGSEEERGVYDNILNIPLRFETATRQYLTAFEERFMRAAEPFKPQFILVSAGFDSHREDPFKFMRLETEDYRRIGELLADLAKRSCDGRLVSVLEGGYNLNALGASVAAYLKGIRG